MMSRLAALLLPAIAGAEMQNVLYLLLDDARTSFGAYGHDGPAQGGAYTPHLNALANESIVFEQAYSQISLCLPSRNSFLTGRSPNTTRVYNLLWGTPQPHLPNFRLNEGGLLWSTLPQHFKQHGYNVAGVGKIFHDSAKHLVDSWSWALSNQNDVQYSWRAASAITPSPSPLRRAPHPQSHPRPHLFAAHRIRNHTLALTSSPRATSAITPSL